MRNTFLITSVAAAAVLLSSALGKPADSKDSTAQTTVFSFEDSTVPVAWQTKDADLSISDRHFKNGARSLRWQWQAGQNLTVLQPEGLKEAGASKDGGINLWIYNETPTTGKLTFRFGRLSELDAAHAEPYEFQCGLDYQGWRAVWVHFKEDAANPAYQGNGQVALEAMQIVAPDHADQNHGAIYFDQVEFSTSVGWLRTPDYQLPFINAKRGGPHVSQDMQDQHIELSAYHWSQLKPPAAPATITPEQKQAFAAIADRYDEWLYGKNLDPNSETYYRIRFASLQKYIEQGKGEFEKLNIHRKDGCITGTPLFALIDPKYHPPFTDVFANCMFPLALDWKLNHNEQSKRRYFDLLDYVHDQGWDEGSSNGTLDHQPLRIAGYVHSVYIMRNELKAAGRLKKEIATMRWYTFFGQGYDKDLPPGNSSDEIRNAMLHKLLVVLAMDDSPEKVRDMQALMHWENCAVTIAPGWVDCIKPDFVGFHHRGIYANTYAVDAFHMAALCFYLQHGTPFSMSDVSADNIRQALLTARILTNKYTAPIAISGRMPFSVGTTNKISPGYAYMALSSDTPDRQMAAAFLRLWEPDSPFYTQELFAQAKAAIFYSLSMGSLQLMKQVVDSGVKPEANPSGNWIKPYGGLMIQRRNDWMLCVKGWSKYVWSFERAANENVFGRNLSFGSIQILASGKPVTQQASGYVEAGWDWNRWPGTTAINLPLDELRGEPGKQRAFNDQTFVGGVSLQGRNGLFAMRLHDTAYNPSFFANKSVFCFDNRVICLGSGIINNDAGRPTETTLFQTHLEDASKPTWINNTTPVVGLDTIRTFNDGGRVWLMDAVGNGYLIPRAESVHVDRRHQDSIENSGKQNTEGNFTTAWIDHGKAPRDASYEYAILVQAASPAQVQQFAAVPGYEVLRRDAVVHAVHDTQSGTVGYAVFKADAPLNLGLLQSVSIPCMAMLRQDHEQLALAVANPDLGLIPSDQPQPADIEAAITDRNLLRSRSPESTVRLTLVGHWKLASGQDKAQIHEDGVNTVLEVSCQNGLTSEVTLHRS